MAIDLSKTRQLVMFEIDRKDPHDLARFHRNVSQMIACKTIGENDFEEVIGSYEGTMNVAYCMDFEAFVRGFSRIEWYMRDQTELYAVDLDNLAECESWSWNGSDWDRKPLSWVAGYATGQERPDTAGWTYFPSSKSYLTLIAEAN
jgi:hypothetical protein